MGLATLGHGLIVQSAYSDDKWSRRKVTDLKRFAVEMKDDDLVVLRIGTSTALGLGQIVGPYEWSAEFGDVDG